MSVLPAAGIGKATSTDEDQRRRAVRLWLYVMAGLVVLMVVVGGATRLTDSGLSIVEWRPVAGAIPPLSQADWNAEFAKYRTSSEFQLANSGMTLAEFKRIYWWEWGHRLLGRLIGVAFLLPLLFFHWRGYVEPALRWRLWGILGLGALQGAIGWWMVASGLVGRVDVAQERLAVHLTMACIILVAIVWTAQALQPARTSAVDGAAPVSRRVSRGATLILALLLVQIALGGLVAGLKAGLASDTWPLMEGALIPPADRLLALSIPLLARHQLGQGLAGEVPPHVLGEELGDDLVAVGVTAADVRQHRDAGRLPKRMLRRQRLGAEHVEHGASDVLGFHCRHQVVVDDQRTAAEIDQPSRLFHSLQPGAVEHALGLGRHRQQQHDEVALAQDLIGGPRRIDTLDVCHRLGRAPRTNDANVERRSLARKLGADGAEAEDAERLAR